MSQIERIGRYQIRGELGRGSVGIVYLAEDTVIGREVAIKVVRRPGPTSPPNEHEQYARFLREARAAGTLLHPNVVAVFDVGEDPDHDISYIAMEYVRGETLEHVLQRGKRLPVEQIRSIALQILTALEAAHATGVVHRDIKPANLLITEDGTVKVADFGIAKIQSAQMTTDGTLLGSPKYMSPEQARSADVDHRTDLFSLGTVLYELATFRPAFPGDSVIQVIQRVVQDTPAAPRSVAPELPAWLDAVIVRAMAKNPNERFADAAAMRAAIEAPPAPAVTATASPATVAPAPTAAVASVSRGGGRHPLPWLVAAIAVAAGIGVGIMLTLDSPAPPAPAPVASAAGAATDGGAGAVAQAEQTVITLIDDVTAAAEEQLDEAAATATEMIADGRFPINSPVKHAHRLGSCKGVLRVYAEHLEYDSYDRDKDDRVWSFADLKDMTVSANGDIHLWVYESDRTTLGLLDRRYKFEPTRGPLPNDAVVYVQEQIRQSSG